MLEVGQDARFNLPKPEAQNLERKYLFFFFSFTILASILENKWLFAKLVDHESQVLAL